MINLKQQYSYSMPKFFFCCSNSQELFQLMEALVAILYLFGLNVEQKEN